ncbi:MAG: ComEC/Rec2 family competence protein [Elainellaceae cyanobacterium]
MLATSAAVICLAYLLGLLFTGIPGTFQGLPIGTIALLSGGPIAAFLVPRLWRTGPRARIWLAAGLVGFIAGMYFQWRVPQPASTDVSNLISDLAPRPRVEVVGTIETSPRLTQSQRIQFELQVTQAVVVSNDQESISQRMFQPVTGRLYVTVPLLQGTGLYPKQIVTITGSLYKPKPAANPGGFDFEQYLAQKGIFAGFSGRSIAPAQNSPAPSIRWKIQQRIVRAQVQSLGVPEGALLSAMVIGGRSVDVPFNIREQFRKTGLAHAIAASGAQVSMVVGVVLALTQRCSTKLRLICGFTILFAYISLTGLEPAVLRAGIMGGVALLALATERRVKPLSSMLLAATLLLVFNPLWTWDLGFQLSFLATLGLLVTVPILSKWLDWLPNALIPLIAVPIAAYLWTLPLQLLTFGVVSPYSIGINIFSSPLIAVISIGGMVSAAAALVYLPLGSAIAWLLYLPTHWFLQLAEWGSHLPGSSFAVGTIAPTQLLLLYGLIILVWFWQRSHRVWWIAFIVGISLVAVPASYAATHRLQITALATADDPVLVLQDRGQVVLINGGSETDAKFTVLPFLAQQGINHIDWAIDPKPEASVAGWQRIAADVSIQNFYCSSGSESIYAAQIATTEAPLADIPNVSLHSTHIQLLNLQPTILQVQLDQQQWLMLSNLPAVEQQAAIAKTLPKAKVLWWSGAALSSELLEAVQPAVAIAPLIALPEITSNWLQEHSVTTYLTGQKSAIQWTPTGGFQMIQGNVE